MERRRRRAERPKVVRIDWRRALADGCVAPLNDGKNRETNADMRYEAAILKHMASTHIINEVGPGVYSQTPVSLGFTKPGLAAAVHFQCVSPSFCCVSILAYP